MYNFNFDGFYSGLLERKYVFDDYLNKYPKSQKLYKAKILDLLNSSYVQKNHSRLRAATTVADLDGVDLDYTEILIKLLKEDWHQSHEDIVMLLDDIKDPRSVDCIYEISLNIPDYDDCMSLAKKCIWALGSINTVAAKEKLKTLSVSKDPIIKESAIKQLKSFNELD
jgi:hypothetical protein